MGHVGNDDTIRAHPVIGANKRVFGSNRGPKSDAKDAPVDEGAGEGAFEALPRVLRN